MLHIKNKCRIKDDQFENQKVHNCYNHKKKGWVNIMKTKLELATLTYKYLDLIDDGYSKGEFEPLFQYLADDCVLESQWVMTPNVGYDAVVSYLSGK